MTRSLPVENMRMLRTALSAVWRSDIGWEENRLRCENVIKPILMQTLGRKFQAEEWASIEEVVHDVWTQDISVEDAINEIFFICS